MAQFILDMGDHHKLFDRLPEIAQGFIEAACFCGISDENGCDFQPSLDDLTPETIARLAGAAINFGRDNADALKTATEYNPDYDMLQAGRDLWFSRNGYGTGFLDRDLGDEAGKLDALALLIGTVDLYGKPGSVIVYGAYTKSFEESDLKPELPDVGGKFGAQMGRAVYRDDDDSPVLARRVTIDEHGYDAGGAYWGIGENLWKIHTAKDHGALAYIRAKTSTAAISKYCNGER